MFKMLYKSSCEVHFKIMISYIRKKVSKHVVKKVRNNWVLKWSKMLLDKVLNFSFWSLENFQFP